jgi:aminopeptidase N
MCLFSLNSEIEQVVLVLVLEKSRYLSVTLMQRNGARRFWPCFDAQSQQIEHEHDF